MIKKNPSRKPAFKIRVLDSVGEPSAELSLKLLPKFTQKHEKSSNILKIEQRPLRRQHPGGGNDK